MSEYLSHSEQSLIDSLAEQGWWFGSSLFSVELLGSLAKNAVELATSNVLAEAAVGRGQSKQQLANVRSDKIQWIDPDSDTHIEFLRQCEQLQQSLNRELYLGVNTIEAHYAHYGEGAFYQRHLDSFKGAQNRMVSMVVYLNPNWQPEHAGELELWSQAGSPLGYVAPKMGDVLLMLSEDMPHQVLPTTVDRYSIAAWFRC